MGHRAGYKSPNYNENQRKYYKTEKGKICNDKKGNKCASKYNLTYSQYKNIHGAIRRAHGIDGARNGMDISIIDDNKFNELAEIYRQLNADNHRGFLRWYRNHINEYYNIAYVIETHKANCERR